MDKQELNSLIKETIALGDDIVFTKIDGGKVERYKKLLGEVVRNYKQYGKDDEISKRTIYLIEKEQRKRINFFEKIAYFFMVFHATGGQLLTSNSKTDIEKRYILSINSKLSQIIE